MSDKKIQYSLKKASFTVLLRESVQKGIEKVLFERDLLLLVRNCLQVVWIFIFPGMEVFCKCLTFLTMGNTIGFNFYSLLLSLVPPDSSPDTHLPSVPPAPQAAPSQHRILKHLRNLQPLLPQSLTTRQPAALLATFIFWWKSSNISPWKPFSEETPEICQTW